MSGFQTSVTQAVKRIERMEFYFDALMLASENCPDLLAEDLLVKGMLEELTAYYEGGQWMKDYTLDEQGLLPPKLKRGVLSQDGVFNLLARIFP